MPININDTFDVNAPKVIDGRYSVGGVTPYASVAAANLAIPISKRALGLTVLIGTDEYWYQSGITDLDLVIKGGGAGGIILPIERTVYLFQDTTYATAAGISNNAYTTIQAAYTAADTLQQSLGGTNIVYIKVIGLTTSSLTLTADYNQYVRIIGESPSSSSIGSITLNNPSGNAYNIAALYLSNITVGNISARPTGVTGNGGNINLFLDNAKTGNVSNYISSSNSAGSSGNINISSVSYSTSKVGVIENSIQANPSTGVMGSLSIIGMGRIAVDYIGNGFSDKLGVSGGNIILYNVDILAELFGISIWRLSYDGCNIKNTTTVGSVVFNQALVILTANSEFIFDSVKIEGAGGIAVLSIYGFAFSPYVYLTDCVTEGLLFWGAEYLEIYNTKSENTGSFAMSIVNCTTVRVLNSLLAEYSNGANVFDIDDSGFGVLALKILNSSLLFGSGSIDAVSATGIESGASYFENTVGANITITPLALDV